MSLYSHHRARVGIDGNTPQEIAANETRRNQIEIFLNSPSLSHVTLNDEDNTRPSIVSDVETFNKRRFLFLPDSEINVGDYINHRGETYLATDMKDNEIYPELIAELCNETFPLSKGKTTIVVGMNELDRPIYDTIEDIIHLPCVMTDSIYSALSNAAIPLPTGALIMKIPYDADNKVAINYEIKVRDAEYKTTEISYEYVINEVGYIEIHLQRKTGGEKG